METSQIEIGETISDEELRRLASQSIPEVGESISPEKLQELAKPEGHWKGWIEPSLKEVGRQVMAVPETAGTLATGMAAFPISGIAGLAKTITSGVHEGAKTIEKVQKALTYQPRQREAQEAVGLALKPIEWMQQARDYWGNAVYETTGSADLAAIAATSLELGFYSLPGMKSKVRLTKLKPWEKGISPESFIKLQKEQLLQNLEASRKVPKDALKKLREKEIELRKEVLRKERGVPIPIKATREFVGPNIIITKEPGIIKTERPPFFQFERAKEKPIIKPAEPIKEPIQEKLITEEKPFELTREDLPPKILGPLHKKAVFPTEKIRTETAGTQKTLLPPKKGEQMEIGEVPSKVPKAAQPQGIRSLVSDIIAEGGLYDESLPGEIRDLAAGYQAKGGVQKFKRVPAIVKEKTGRTVDDIIPSLRESGYLIEDTSHFLELLEKDIRAIAEGKEQTRVVPSGPGEAIWDRAWQNYLKGNEETLSFLGTQQVWEKVAAEVPKLRQLSKEALRKTVDQIDVEARFKRIGASETGYHVKAFFSQAAMHEEYGLEVGKNLAKMVKYSRKDLQEIPLLYENPSSFAKLPKAEQARLKPAVDYFGKYFEDSLKEYKAKAGLKMGFKERIIAEIEDLLSKDISKEDRLSLAQALQDAKQMNFVHIPSALWFESYLGRDIAGAQKVLRILARQERKTFWIQDLIDRGIIKPEQVNAVDILASYARRKGRDMAILNLRNAALKEGVAFPIPKEGYVKIPAYRAPALADTYLHPMLADYIGSELLGKGLELGSVGKWLSLSKMAAFINPLILPMYDTVQHGMMALLSGRGHAIPLHLARGARHYFRKTPEYWEALDNGIASKPYDNPFGTYQSLTEWTKKNKAEKTLHILETVFPQNTIKNAYNASWHIAWELDKIVRMGSYDLLIKKGFSPREAAQIAAKFHSDYASVPPHLRRILNIPFFTPTFKITMGKLYGQMITDAISSSAKLGGLIGKVSPQTAIFAKGLLATAIINEAFDLFMRNLGFERDEWGRRYVRKVETEEGEKELVTTWSVPSNLFLKYLYRVRAAVSPEEEKPMLRFIEASNWEIQPVWRVAWEILENKDSRGDKIVNPLDRWHVKTIKRLKYSITNIVRLLGLLDRDKTDVEGRRQFAKEFGQLLELATHPFTFKYIRSAEEGRLLWKIKTLQKQLRDLATKGDLEPEHYDVFIEKLDKLLEGY